jgi:hypothetical protein
MASLLSSLRVCQLVLRQVELVAQDCTLQQVTTTCHTLALLGIVPPRKTLQVLVATIRKQLLRVDAARGGTVRIFKGPLPSYVNG